MLVKDKKRERKAKKSDLKACFYFPLQIWKKSSRLPRVLVVSLSSRVMVVFLLPFQVRRLKGAKKVGGLTNDRDRFQEQQGNGS